MTAEGEIMIRKRSMLRVFAFVCTLSIYSVAFAAEIPGRTAGGQTLCVPEAHARLGEVYYVLAGTGTQFTWDTDAPALRLVATCNRVVGYLVAPFDIEEGQPPLSAGAMRVPVASLNTGYDGMDGRLHGERLLNRAQHPEIAIQIIEAGPARNVDTVNKVTGCEFELKGELTIKDKTVRFETPAVLSILPMSRATEQFSPSDLLTLRTKFTVKLADLGIDPGAPTVADMNGTNVEIGLYFMGTTVQPEKNFDPRVKDEWYVRQLQFMTRLRDFNDPDDAYAYGRAFMKEIWDNAQLLNELASGVLTDEHVKRRDLAFVEKAILRANELSDHKDPTYLNTLARLRYELGDLEGAIEWQRKAVNNLEGQPFFIPPPIRAALQQYEAEAKRRAETDDATP